MAKKLAFTHPGKLGDALYSLPVMRHICNVKDKKCDFYTSEYCKPLTRLVEYQPFVDCVVIPHGYKIERMDMGCQPYKMPTGVDYETVYHLGFRNCPDRPLPEFIANSIGVGIKVEIKYDYPEIETLDEPYVILAPRGRTTFAKLFEEFIELSPMKVVVVGALGDNVFVGDNIVDITGMDMLETTSWMAKSKGFVGLMSAMLVLANGFKMNKVSPHDGHSWNLSHAVKSDSNFYPVNPTANEVLRLLG